MTYLILSLSAAAAYYVVCTNRDPVLLIPVGAVALGASFAL